MALEDGAVSTEFSAQRIPEGVLDMLTVEPLVLEGQKVFVYYNGPTDQLSGVSAGACVLDPGMSPHPVHQRAGNTWHGITNTGQVKMTFYWSKWLAKGFGK